MAQTQVHYIGKFGNRKRFIRFDLTTWQTIKLTTFDEDHRILTEIILDIDTANEFGKQLQYITDGLKKSK